MMLFMQQTEGIIGLKGRSDISTETEWEKDKYEATDSNDTVDGGSHMIEGGPDINN